MKAKVLRIAAVLAVLFLATACVQTVKYQTHAPQQLEVIPAKAK